MLFQGDWDSPASRSGSTSSPLESGWPRATLVTPGEVRKACSFPWFSWNTLLTLLDTSSLNPATMLWGSPSHLERGQVGVPVNNPNWAHSESFQPRCQACDCRHLQVILAPVLWVSPSHWSLPSWGPTYCGAVPSVIPHPQNHQHCKMVAGLHLLVWGVLCSSRWLEQCW